MMLALLVRTFTSQVCQALNFQSVTGGDCCLKSCVIDRADLTAERFFFILWHALIMRNRKGARTHPLQCGELCRGHVQLKDEAAMTANGWEAMPAHRARNGAGSLVPDHKIYESGTWSMVSVPVLIEAIRRQIVNRLGSTRGEIDQGAILKEVLERRMDPDVFLKIAY